MQARHVAALGVVSIHARHYWRASPFRTLRAAVAAVGFNPRPPLLASEPFPGSCKPRLHTRFNPRPPLLASEPCCGRRCVGCSVVSIHARHYWRASPGAWPTGLIDHKFQSTPAITGERARFDAPDDCGWHIVSIHARHYWRASPSHRDDTPNVTRFQSTPAITGERAAIVSMPWPPWRSFNPRPPLLASEPADGKAAVGCLRVSIHARHYWRASRT